MERQMIQSRLLSALVKMTPLLKGVILNTIMLDSDTKDQLVTDYETFVDSFRDLVERSRGKRQWTDLQNKEFEKVRPKP
jgi:hypothetical protein